MAARRVLDIIPPLASEWGVRWLLVSPRRLGGRLSQADNVWLLTAVSR